MYRKEREETPKAHDDDYLFRALRFGDFTRCFCSPLTALFSSVAAIATRESLDVVVIYVKQSREKLTFFLFIHSLCENL